MIVIESFRYLSNRKLEGMMSLVRRFFILAFSGQLSTPAGKSDSVRSGRQQEGGGKDLARRVPCISDG